MDIVLIKTIHFSLYERVKFRGGVVGMACHNDDLNPKQPFLESTIRSLALESLAVMVVYYSWKVFLILPSRMRKNLNILPL